MCETCKGLEARVAALEQTLGRLATALSSNAVRSVKANAGTGIPPNWPSNYPTPGDDVVGASRVSAWCKGFAAGVEGKKPRDNPYDWNSRGHKQAWEKGWMAHGSYAAKKGAA